jgi:hypothetical protein
MSAMVRLAPWLGGGTPARIGFMNVVAGRPAARAVAWSLAGLTVLTLAATLVLLGLDVRVISASRILFYMLGTLALILCAGIGRLIASRVPGNAIGWLLIMIGLLLAASLFAEQYALHGLAAAPGSLPSVRQIGALSGAWPYSPSSSWSSSSCCSPTAGCHRGGGDQSCGGPSWRSPAPRHSNCRVPPRSTAV